MAGMLAFLADFCYYVNPSGGFGRGLRSALIGGQPRDRREDYARAAKVVAVDGALVGPPLLLSMDREKICRTRQCLVKVTSSSIRRTALARSSASRRRRS